MRGCQAFLLTPVMSDAGGFEAFGLVYLEAGAAGRPVVGVYDSGAQDAKKGGPTGKFQVRKHDQFLVQMAHRRIVQDGRRPNDARPGVDTK